jgi:hypothetical protein
VKEEEEKKPLKKSNFDTQTFATLPRPRRVVRAVVASERATDLASALCASSRSIIETTPPCDPAPPAAPALSPLNGETLAIPTRGPIILLAIRLATSPLRKPLRSRSRPREADAETLLPRAPSAASGDPQPGADDAVDMSGQSSAETSASVNMFSVFSSCIVVCVPFAKPKQFFFFLS